MGDHPLWSPLGAHSVWCFPTAPRIVRRTLLCVLMMSVVTMAMPQSLEQSFFCFVPTPEVSAAFLKAMSAISYASAKLVTAAQGVRAWDLFLTQ